MNNLLRSALEKRKRYLIHEWVASGLYEKDSAYLFTWTLSDLEREYKFLRTIRG